MNMELYEEEKNEKKSKLPMIIGICIVILIIMVIAIIYGIIYLKSTVITININGVRNNEIENILYIDESKEETEIYIPIRKIASFFGYEDYRGDYKNKSEDSSKCYVKNEYETAMFTLDSDTLIKTRGDSDYEYVEIDEEVFEKDGELYTTVDGIEKAYNVEISCDWDKRKIDIYTMDYLIQYYALKLNIEDYSEEFTDKKAIFENMMIIKSNKQYGVVEATTGQSILENKYEQISYLPATSDFLVKSGGKYGVVSNDGTIKVRIAYDQIKIMDNQNGLYLVKQNNLYGVVDTSGKVIINPEYKQIGVDTTKFAQNGLENQYVLFDELIPIKDSNDLWGFFSTEGEKITDFVYTGLGCTTAKANNSYPAIVIPSYKVVVVEKDKYFNLMMSNGHELINSFVLDSVYLITNTATGENTFYMTYNGQTKNIEEELSAQGVE